MDGAAAGGQQHAVVDLVDYGHQQAVVEDEVEDGMMVVMAYGLAA